MSRSFVLAGLAMVGTIIGAGAFALPHLFVRLGIVQGSLVFWAIAILVMCTHVLFVDVVHRVKGVHRLPGYAEQYLGKRWGAFATLTHTFSTYGAHIVYLMLGGTFLRVLAEALGISIHERLAMIVVFLLIASSVWGGLRRVARLEAFATTLMVLFFLFVSTSSLIMPLAATRFVPHLTWTAFGLVLFALSGLPVIAEVVELCGRNVRVSRGAVLLGTFASAAIMWFFAISLAHVGGTRITADPASLIDVLPVWGGILLPVLVLLAIATSYITTAEDLHMSWMRDYKIRERSAWVFTLVPSLVLALLLNQGFLTMGILLGTVCGGANGVLVGMMRLASAEQEKTPFVGTLALVIVFLYTFGVAGQFASWLFV